MKILTKADYYFSYRYYNLNKLPVKRKPILLITIATLITFVFANCNLPRIILAQATDTPTATPVGATPTTTAPPPFATAELGLAENPLILALPPSANSQEQINAAKVIASQFTERTGYTVVTVIPDSYSALIEALENGNAHTDQGAPYVHFHFPGLR